MSHEIVRRLDQPPGGVCAQPSCRRPAAKWVGVINETKHGTVRMAVGVCDECYALITTGKLVAPMGLIGTSDTDRTLPECDAFTAADQSTGGESPVPSPGQEST